MRIVIATQALRGPGGSESYALTVAHELQRMGYEVTVTAEQLGPIAELAERDGLPIARQPSDLPSDCDAVLVQDSIVTAAITTRYPSARLVHVSHSDFIDHQLPVLIPGAVDAVVVLSDRLAERIRALALELEVVRLRQPIATERFVPGAPLSNRPRRALLLGNYLQGDRRAALVEAWERAGVQCSQLGSPTRSELEVLPAIAAADIVVAKGRAALEAMSCARAVYLYDQFGGDGWVTPENYPALEADGFGGLATPAPRTPQDLTGDLAAYRPSMGWVNNELVRTHHGVRRHVAKLLGALRAPGRGERPAPDALQEISRVERLRWRADMRADAAWRDYLGALGTIDQWRQRALEAERQVAVAQALLGTRRARAGLAVGRALDRVRGRG